MPLHTRFRPACEEAFCPHYDTARQNFASKVQWSSWEIISFDSLIVQWREDSKIVEAIADTIFAFRGLSEWFAEWNWNVLFCSLGSLTLQVTQKNTRKPQKSTQNVVY